LLFSYSSISICQIGQNEGNLLFVVIINRFVHFEVNKYILHEEDEIASFPCKGFRWVKLDILRGFWCRRGYNGFSYGFGIGIGVVCWFIGVSEFRLSVSRNQMWSGQGFEVSVGVKVLECAVKILARLFGESTPLLDFETFRQNV
jgi:hypothetical protein